jgi:transcriptional regulator with XRE-family HTH domain
MGRSLRVRPEHLESVKRKLKQRGYARQQDLAEELQLSRSTLSNYLNGRSVDQLNLITISDVLQVDWQSITDFSDEIELAVLDPELLAPFTYIERGGLEARCIEILQGPHALLRIKAPRLMGKTALSYRLFSKLEGQGYKTASLNFHLASQMEFGSLSAFLKWFCSAITQLLDLPNQLADYWDEEFSTSKMSCTEYLEKYLLTNLSGAMVLCLDEVDRIFPYPEIAADFFGLLRAWHERGKLSPVWQKLRLVLIYSTEVYIPLNLYESPFNVGDFVELSALSRAEVEALVKQSGLSWTSEAIEQIMTCLGGHPAYVQRLLQAQRSGAQLSQLLEAAPTESGIYGDELRHLWRMLERQPTLVDAMRSLLKAHDPIPIPTDASQQLYRLGLIDVQGNASKIRCELYRQYFSYRLTN